MGPRDARTPFAALLLTSLAAGVPVAACQGPGGDLDRAEPEVIVEADPGLEPIRMAPVHLEASRSGAQAGSGVDPAGEGGTRPDLQAASDGIADSDVGGVDPRGRVALPPFDPEGSGVDGDEEILPRRSETREQLRSASAPPVWSDPGDLLAEGDSIALLGPEPQAVLPPVEIPAGTQLPLIVLRTLSTESDSAGAPFTAHVEDDVLAVDGMVLVPRGSVVRGRVRESQQSTGPEVDPILDLEIVSIGLNGAEHPVEARVVSSETQSGRRDSNEEAAAKVALGAAAGAILGKILGSGNDDTLKGAAAGAAAGGMVAAATRAGHAVLPEGGRIVIRLDEAVPLGGK